MSSSLPDARLLSRKLLIDACRESVLQSYHSAESDNRVKFLRGDTKATSEYIYDNQKEDAAIILHHFEDEMCRVVSVSKKTKVGMDGLMIEVAMRMTTHPDDNFVLDPANVRMITGMSNVSWEKDMKEKAPSCFRHNIFHHGKLKKSNLKDLRNGLIIIDEIDTGDKEFQMLHKTLHDAGVLNVEYMMDHNIRFLFASATMVRELHELYRWGQDLHKWVKMKIPPNYIGHYDFYQMGIICEFYPLKTAENADRWIQEDILDNYGSEFRVHIVRLNNKSEPVIRAACARKGVVFENHTSSDRISLEALKRIFEGELQNHIVIGVKGFYRRANLIPNAWKMRVGAVHEYYKDASQVDYNTQNQGLPGRLSGYWRDIIEAGHKVGPIRTSIDSVIQYEKVYNDPFGDNSYQTEGFKKKNGRLSISPSNCFLAPVHISGLIATDYPKPCLGDDSIQISVCSEPIVVISLNADEVIDNVHDIAAVWRLIRSKNQAAAELYEVAYEAHCWNMNTQDKCDKWGLKKMKANGAMSGLTNIYDKRHIDVIMIYYNTFGPQNELILQPWNGTALTAEEWMGFIDTNETEEEAAPERKRRKQG
jgi:hypothetical protein